MARLLLIGTGLIGGSFALATRRAGTFDHIVGWDTDPAALAEAHRLGIVDEISSEAPDTRTDAVFVAVPPSRVADVVARLVRAGLADTTPVFDAASVKGSVLAAIERALGAVPNNFVPCHPMAGAEHKGPAAASAELFSGSRVFVTPLPTTARAALARVRSWWSACGARVVTTTAHVHDERVALTSHLPHLLAFAYTRGLTAAWDDTLPDYAGGGFRDFTRIAESDPALWRDIVESNAPQVEAVLAQSVEQTRHLLELLRAGRFDELEKALAEAQAIRRRFFDQAGDDGR